jgi:glycosyltransferase involved in cell wall biosynthesis
LINSAATKERAQNDSLHGQRNANEAARLLVGTVGQLDSIKGHEDFVRAAALIAKHNLFVNFVIFGEDTSQEASTARVWKI